MCWTCLLLSQGKEASYTWNSLTCALHCIWGKWPSEGFYPHQLRKRNTWSRFLAPMPDTRRSGQLGYLRNERYRLWSKDTRQWFVNINLTAAFRAKPFCRHAGGIKEHVHLHQNWHHLCPEYHLCQLVLMRVLTVQKWTVCHPDIWKYIPLFWTFNYPIFMHMSRIACAIEIVFQNCRPTNEHPLVGTPFAVWWYGWHPVWSREQTIEWTWQWWWALIQRNRILESYYSVLLADTFKYISKNMFICIVEEQCNNDRHSTWWRWNVCQNTITEYLCQIVWMHIVDTPVAKWATTEHQWLLVLKVS